MLYCVLDTINNITFYIGFINCSIKVSFLRCCIVVYEELLQFQTANKWIDCYARSTNPLFLIATGIHNMSSRIRHAPISTVRTINCHVLFSSSYPTMSKQNFAFTLTVARPWTMGIWSFWKYRSRNGCVRRYDRRFVKFSTWKWKKWVHWIDCFSTICKLRNSKKVHSGPTDIK